MKNYLLLGALLLLLGACSKKTEAKIDAEEQVAQETAVIGEHPKEKATLDGCATLVEQQEGEGISRSDADKFCLCSLTELRGKYSAEQLEELDALDDSDARKKELEEASFEAAKACGERLKQGVL